MSASHKIIIIGGGAAGITVAASLKRHSDGKQFDITIIDPASHHYYQPAFTLVGGGCYCLDKTRRSMSGLIPAGVTWLQKSVADIDPLTNTVELDDASKQAYDFLVVCPGVVLDWDGIEGLKETIGQNGVCTNYSPEQVEYTWTCLQNTKVGDKLFFTQAPLPFKCPGAPQKIAYLAADYLKTKNMLEQCELHFTNPGPGMFGVPYFAKQLSKVADGYGFHKDLLHKLTNIK